MDRSFSSGRQCLEAKVFKTTGISCSDIWVFVIILVELWSSWIFILLTPAYCGWKCNYIGQELCAVVHYRWQNVSNLMLTLRYRYPSISVTVRQWEWIHLHALVIKQFQPFVLKFKALRYSLLRYNWLMYFLWLGSFRVVPRFTFIVEKHNFWSRANHMPWQTSYVSKLCNITPVHKTNLSKSLFFRGDNFWL